MELSRDEMLKLYTNLVRVRKLDEKMIECLYGGKVLTFFHSGQGQEAAGVALNAFLREDDYLFYHHRGHGISFCLPRGMTAKEILAEHFGKATGGAGGFAGFHYADKNLGISGIGGMVGGELTLAAGVGIACKLKGKGQVVVSSFGDGATCRGTFHEAMVMAATWKLPVVWLCENNFYQAWTCLKVTHPKEDLADFAYGYGIPSAIIDGQDIMAVYEALEPAVERARTGKGPTFLEIKTYRFRPHAEGMPDSSVQCEGGMRPIEEIEAWMKRDPVRLFRERLIELDLLTEAEVERIDREAKEEMEEAERFASDSPYPDPAIFNKVLYAE